jgi:hypothetical protein
MGTPTSPATRTEALNVFAADLRTGTLSDEDRQYLGSVISPDRGQAAADAEKRVAGKFAQTKAAIDAAENNDKRASPRGARARHRS